MVLDPRRAAARVLLLLWVTGLASGELSLATMEGVEAHGAGSSRMRKLGPAAFTAERQKGGGWALRMQVKVDTASSGTLPLAPGVALKSNTGVQLGYSLSAMNRLLLLGFGGNGIMSGRGDIGGYFYTDQTLLQDVPKEGFMANNEVFITGTSDVLACFSQANTMQCYIYNRTFADQGLPKEQVFNPGPMLSTPRCNLQPTGCFARIFGVWKQAVAVVGQTPDGKRYVSTYFLSGKPLFWNCTSGCNGYVAGSVLSSTDPTWGASVALGPDILAIGVPFGTGKVIILQATGALAASGTGGHSAWAQQTVLQGPATGAGFGSTMSLSDDYLVVGAPGNRTNAAAAHMYKIIRTPGSPTTMTLFCSTVHNRSTANSNLGFSLAQASNGGDTMVLVGAPGENLVYSFLLRYAADVCKPLETYGEPSDDQSVSDQFGYSVAMTDQFLMIGAPFYQRYFKPFVSGLIFTDAICFPGSVIQNTNLNIQSSIYTYKKCVLCGPSQTSSGGRDAQCDQCIVDVPKANAVLTYGCVFQCIPGFFGDTCVLCSVLNANVPKPPNTHWKDGVSTCDWECDGGYSEAKFPNGTRSCVQCGNTQFFLALSNVEWLVGQCAWTCQLGFFRNPKNPSDGNCYLCSVLAPALDFPLPANAEWQDGLGECIWGPKIGYACTPDPGAVCSPCPQIPPNSQFTDTAFSKALSRCDFSCLPGYFGHPTYPNVCIRCPDLMTSKAMAPLPNNAFWPSNPAYCNASSWQCNANYTRSSMASFCCPPMPIANSFYKPDYAPCGYACDLAYRWVNTTASCQPCGFTKANSTWLLDCDYKCEATFFGRQELGECVGCRQYRTLIGTPAPPNSSFPVTSANCTVTDWECAAGFTKSMVAAPAGCCPNSLPADRALRLPGIQNVQLCGFTCLVGFKWNRVYKLCELCDPATASTASRPVNSEWHPENCAYVCKQGFVTVGTWASPTAPLQCLECGDYAVRQGWKTPANSYWQNSSTIVGTCTDNSWLCNAGFLKNVDAKLCCPQADLPTPGASALPQFAAWDSATCNWNCLPTYFPSLLSRSEQTCMTCTNYLNGVPNVAFCTELVQFEPSSSRCQGRAMAPSPTQCSLAVQTELQMAGLTVDTFSEDVRLLTLIQLSLISNSSGGGLAKLLFVEDIEQASNRRQTVVDPLPGVKVGTQINGISPLFIASAIETMKTAFPQKLQTALAAIGIKTVITLMGSPSAIYGPGSWSCTTNYVYNSETETCCYTGVGLTTSTSFRLPPAMKDRYVWQENGCDWTCKDTYQGADCQTCTEFKEGKWKPANSQWDDSSPACTWSCLSGYVKSDRGDTCISVQDLINTCSSANRCALCVEQTNCVWCAGTGKCVPGSQGPASTGPGFGCPYVNLALGQIASGTTGCTCSTSADTCFDECKYTNCGGCVADQFCGWCANKSKCMLGEYSRPLIETCRAGEGWSTGVYTKCTDDTSIWLIGLICASVSTVLVGMMCCYFVLRVRAAAREQQMNAAAGPIRFGGAPAPANGGPQVSEAFLATFPVFTYSMKDAAHALSNTSPGGNAAEDTRQDDGDEDPVCTICLGTFCDGEECRMLPCLHVFHKACIDQWLGVSQECPLCKQSVLGAASQSTAFAEASRRVGVQSPPLAAEEVIPGDAPNQQPRESVDIAL